ncbi:MAG: serine hydrolase domain-containing protein [Pseudoclavibacter sp.]|nr:serine hydrolase domain-containing protein [Pseudoclavibacter sp.]
MPNPRRSRPIRVVLAIACALALAGCAASPGAAPEPPELPLVPTEQAEFRTEDVQQAMHRLMDAGAPAVLVEVRDEHGVWRSSLGERRYGDGQAADPLAPVRVASITKSMIGVILMQLVQEGRLSLDDDVERHAPGLLSPPAPVTLRMLADHTSGAPEYIGTFDLADVRSLPGVLTADYEEQELVERVREQPWRFAPGSSFEYSNTNYLVLGLVLERAGGRPLAELIRERVAEPIGAETTFLPSGLETPEGMAHGYFTESGVYVDVTRQSGSIWAGAGGVVSTVGEVNTFFRAVMRGEYLDRARLAEYLRLNAWGYGIGVQGREDPCPAPAASPAPPAPERTEAADPGSRPGPLAPAGPGATAQLQIGEPGMVYGHMGSGLGFRMLSFSTPDGARQVTVSWTASPPDYGADPRLEPAQAVVDAALLATCPG